MTKSYESSNWIIKIWRKRWYLYAIFLYLKLYIDVKIWIDFLLNDINNSDIKNLRNEWKLIKKHTELSKMHKYS